MLATKPSLQGRPLLFSKEVGLACRRLTNLGGTLRAIQPIVDGESLVTQAVSREALSTPEQTLAKGELVGGWGVDQRVLERGAQSGAFRADLDPWMLYRMMRDSIWVSVRWYRPDGPAGPQQLADTYVDVLLGGIAVTKRD